MIACPSGESDMQDTVVVIPCFNEASRLDIGRLSKFTAQTPSVALLFVNDGSTDTTREVLDRLQHSNPQRIRIHHAIKNSGKAEAVRQGILIAMRTQAKFIGYWDADLATPLEAILQCRDVLLRRAECHTVLGSRVAMLGHRIERKWTRHILGRAFAWAASIVLGLKVYDTQCGAKMFRASPDLLAVFQQRFHSRWIFDVEILARMIRSGMCETTSATNAAIYEHPLDQWNDVPGSKLKSTDFFRAAYELASIHYRYMRVDRKPEKQGQPTRGAGSGAKPVGIERASKTNPESLKVA